MSMSSTLLTIILLGKLTVLVNRVLIVDTCNAVDNVITVSRVAWSCHIGFIYRTIPVSLQDTGIGRFKATVIVTGRRFCTLTLG